MQYAIGIDIGGTTTQLGLVDKQGNITFSSIIDTNKNEPFSMFFPRLVSEIEFIINKHNYSFPIGIGAPNGNYLRGTIEHPANLNWEGITPLADLLAKRFNVDVSLTNDANAAAMGELIFGAGKGLNNFIMVTLGTGLGSGIIVDGNLLYGASGFAGEMGHITVIENGRHSPFARKGSLEAYCSASGIIKTFYELINENNLSNEYDKSTLNDFPEDVLTTELIFLAAKAGDIIAKKAFEKMGETLGKAFANTAMLFSPEAFILSGGLANAAKFYLDIAQNTMDNNLIPVFKGCIKVIISSLLDKNAAVIGAAALAFNNNTDDYTNN